MNHNVDDNVPFSSRFEKRYIFITLLFLALLVGSVYLLVTFIHDTILSVVFAFTTLALAALTIIFLRKAVKSGTFEEGMYLVFVALGKFFNFLLMPMSVLFKTIV